MLRERGTLIGAYDFREWEMNELARQLAAEGKTAAAIAMLQLNEEFYGTSASIPSMLGGLYERENRKDDAIAAYRRALELRERLVSESPRVPVLLNELGRTSSSLAELLLRQGRLAEARARRARGPAPASGAEAPPPPPGLRSRPRPPLPRPG